MEFKRPMCKRYSEPTVNSPKNRKKSKLLSTTIASPSTHKSNINYFDDDFSQMIQSQQFQTQFMRQSTSCVIQTENRPFERTPIQIENRPSERTVNDLSFSSYNFTQTGFSQILGSSQFEQSLPLGQRTRSSQQQNDDAETINTQLLSQLVQRPEQNAEYNEPDDENDENIVQSSQMFLNEVSALHLDISSMIDETLHANKIVEIEDQFDTSKFDAYKSNVTFSDYVQMKRPSDKTNQTHFNNTDDQILAEFVDCNEADVSEELNEAIDPDSSALRALLDDIDEDVVNTSVEHVRDDGNKRKSENFQQNEKNPIVNPFKPVSSSNFGSMGPFFGLPEKVRKLIKEYKQIDDLYGEIFSLKKYNFVIDEKKEYFDELYFWPRIFFRLAKRVSSTPVD